LKIRLSGRKSLLLIFLLLSFLLLIFFGVLIYMKKININQFWVKQYSIHGIDVSHHQGEIDWKKLKEEKVQFAYIKATEGSGHVDDQFEDNRKQAQAVGIHTGAYHFFSFESAPETQAKIYMETVGDLVGQMIPAVDVEYYVLGNAKMPEPEEIASSLQRFLDILEEHYGKKPVIYTTYKFYFRYIRGKFSDYPLWIRNTYYPPLDIAGWSFWQYCDEGRFEGVADQKGDVDLDVFRGTEVEFQKFFVQQK